MIEVVRNDRLGKNVRVKCSPEDSIGDLKKLIAAQTGARPRGRAEEMGGGLQDHVTLADYEIRDCANLELYYG